MSGRLRTAVASEHARKAHLLLDGTNEQPIVQERQMALAQAHALTAFALVTSQWAEFALNPIRGVPPSEPPVAS